MGRRRKTLHDYAAEFSELSVRREPAGPSAPGPAVAVETLFCTPCQLPLRVRRDRILEHLSSGRHCRNRRLLRQLGLRAPGLRSAGPDSSLSLSLPLPLDVPSLLSHPSFLITTGSSTGYSMVPSPPSYHKLLIPHHPIPTTHRDDPTPSTSRSHPSLLATFHTRIEPLGQSGPTPDASNSPMPPSCHGSSGIGLVLFGAGLVSKALLQSLVEETGCCLLYVVEDRPEEVERAFGTKVPASTRVLRQQDAAIALGDPRVSGAIICSPPDEASEMVRDALRAGKGVFCEGLPSLDRQTAEACFDEASRCGRPLVCGFYKRFDPALQFLYKKVRDSQALGRIHRISTISSLYPAASLSLLKASGGIFYNAAVHDIDIISLLLGESVPDTVFSLGHAFCADTSCLRDVDTVAISMKFPSGAIVTLDVSQHCTRSCDQRLEVGSCCSVKSVLAPQPSTSFPL
ncbi:inositol 2-dehydrogenase-like [Poecile atricapillus]|uniref:inositol 2-dehydrogenase-like n=1 Tax=Poecile atricapillus TaxID=48891 RepID=UPI002739426C|nr:inositol 2-dehydrogenase-like [Poecile atricapillus]